MRRKDKKYKGYKIVISRAIYNRYIKLITIKDEDEEIYCQQHRGNFEKCMRISKRLIDNHEGNKKSN